MKIAGKVSIGEQQPKGPTTQIPMMNGSKSNGITQQKTGTKRRANGFSIDELLQQQEEGEGQQQQNGHHQKWGKQGDSVQMMITPKRSRKGTMGKDLDDNKAPDEDNWLRAANPDSLKTLHCELENWETWEKFSQLGTEMIITKSGRRMFPVLRLRLFGTRPGFLYHIYLDIVPVEGNHRFRYAYNKSQWQSAGKADKTPFGRLFLHSESPFTGEQLAQPNHVVSFDKAKLTNNSGIDNYDQLLLNSMHKYRPRIHVFCLPKGHPMGITAPKEFRTKADLDRLAASVPYKTFTFPKTTFVAVTAYQNQLVTQKKIELNPFAKGFRDQQQKQDGTTTPMAATAGADQRFHSASAFVTPPSRQLVTNNTTSSLPSLPSTSIPKTPSSSSISIPMTPSLPSFTNPYSSSSSSSATSLSTSSYLPSFSPLYPLSLPLFDHSQLNSPNHHHRQLHNHLLHPHHHLFGPNYFRPIPQPSPNVPLSPLLHFVLFARQQLRQTSMDLAKRGEDECEEVGNDERERGVGNVEEVEDEQQSEGENKVDEEEETNQ